MNSISNIPMDLWPFRPRPKYDESFTSWFCRLAWANSLSPSDLYRVALPGARMHRLDLDRFTSDELLNNLERHTGVASSDLAERTFRSWFGNLFEDDSGVEKLIWLPAAGAKLSSKTFGNQLCPRCLSEYETPTLNRIHRLAFVTTCAEHGCYLIDRCPSCSLAIQPLYQQVLSGSMCVCWNCGFDYRAADATQVEGPDNDQSLIEIAERGWASLGEHPFVHSISFFRILWVVYRLLATGRFALPLRSWVSRELNSANRPATDIPRLKEIERLNPRCRHALLVDALQLLEDWPERFVRACRDVGISSRVIVKAPKKTPFALWKAVRGDLTAPSREISRGEIEAAKAILAKRGTRPTYRSLTELLGAKFQTHMDLAEPARKCRPYGTGRYWKLDGVSAEVKAAAKSAAALQGENVGPWVDKTLRDTLKRQNQM